MPWCPASSTKSGRASTLSVASTDDRAVRLGLVGCEEFSAKCAPWQAVAWQELPKAKTVKDVPIQRLEPCRVNRAIPELGRRSAGRRETSAPGRSLDPRASVAEPQETCGLRRRRRTGSVRLEDRLERAKGFEPSTPTLARLCSTPELRPRSVGGRLSTTARTDCKTPARKLS